MNDFLFILSTQNLVIIGLLMYWTSGISNRLHNTSSQIPQKRFTKKKFRKKVAKRAYRY